MVERRLRNECSELKHKYKYKYIVITYDNNNNKNNCKSKTIVVSINESYKFILNDCYPFKPPKLLINGNNYLNLLANQNTIYKQINYKRKK